jgi:hypothetical protein
VEEAECSTVFEVHVELARAGARKRLLAHYLKSASVSIRQHTSAYVYLLQVLGSEFLPTT